MPVGFTQCAQTMWLMSYLCKVLYLWKAGSLRSENLGIKEALSYIYNPGMTFCRQVQSRISPWGYQCLTVPVRWSVMGTEQIHPPRDFDTGKVQRVGFSLVLPSFLFVSLLFSLCISLYDLCSKKNWLLFLWRLACWSALNFVSKASCVSQCLVKRDGTNAMFLI